MREGCWLSFLLPSSRTKSLHFFGEVSRAEALGVNREDRPAAFAGRFRIGFSWVGIPLLPTQKSILSFPSNAPSPDITSAGQDIRQLRLQLSSERRVQRAGPVTASKQNYGGIKTGAYALPREQQGGYLLTGPVVSGAEQA